MEICKCWVCGEPATHTMYFDSWDRYHGSRKIEPNGKVRAYCLNCYNKTIKDEAAERKEYVRLKKREMFKTACNILEKQGVNMYEFKEAIEAVEEHITEFPDKYDSSYEVISAIVLIHDRIRVKPQYKVARYQVDFLLPDMMVVLEIDGERHRNRKGYDTKRDSEIKRILGPGWEIVRIDTDYIDQKAIKLPDAIRAITARRDSGLLI